MSQAKAAANHGHNIWAFLNVHTNQVLYSLNRRLEPSAIKQLPDIGANHTPAALRKDHWRPFFHVTIPPRVHTWRRLQGLDIYRTLREWRTLHETSWEPSPLLSRLWSEEEIKEWQTKLDQKGGSKKMTVYDLIKREKKKLRLRTIMNQKANSVADLAAVLNQHYDADGKVKEVAESTRQALRQQHKDELAEILRLAAKAKRQRRNATPRGLEAKIVRVKKDETIPKWKRLQEIKALRSQLKKIYWCHEELSRAARAMSNHQMELYMIIRRHVRMAAKASDEAATSKKPIRKVPRKVFRRMSAHEKAAVRRENQRAEDAAERRELRDQAADPRKTLEKATTLAHALEYLKTNAGIEPPAYLQERNMRVKERAIKDLGRVDSAASAAGEGVVEPTTDGQDTAPTADELENALLSHVQRIPSEMVEPEAATAAAEALPKAVYGTEGITVRWSNLLDAEFAPAWPADVKHVHMNSHRMQRVLRRAPRGYGRNASDSVEPIPADVESSRGPATTTL